MKVRYPLAAFLGLALFGVWSVASAAPIDIPLNTWVRRAYAAPGEGPCAGGDCKHMRLAFNYADGRIYFCGGDYGGSPYIDSGRQEIWSYSIGDGSWRLEHPYCGTAGEVNPTHPDEVGWAYDSRRNIFWMIPGYMGQDNGECTTGTQVRNQIMSFDPATDRWSFENRQLPTDVTLGSNGFAQYDSLTDTILQFFYASCSGVLIYDIANDSWTRECHTGNFFLSKEYSAMDRVNRVIYSIDGDQNKLYRYSIDSHRIDVLGDTPVGQGSTRLRPVWDPVNRVILWFDYGSPDNPPDGNGGHLHVYHPDTNSWEDRPVYQPDGDAVVGVNVVFDPYQNVLLVMGSPTYYGAGYFHLYRYGNGTGGPPPPPDTVSPSAPANLRAR
jgi:hypothetical protein